MEDKSNQQEEENTDKKGNSCIDLLEELRADISAKYPNIVADVNEHLDAVSEILVHAEEDPNVGTEKDVDDMIETKVAYMDELANS